jgi:hypothetical protein
MRVFLQEVVLDFPRIVDADAVSQFDLVECVLKKLQLVAVVPWPRELVFIENSEAHRVLPFF